MRGKDRMLRVLEKTTDTAEWILAYEAAWCGLWALLPGQTFGPATVLRGIPESVTGMVFLVLGILYIAALVSGRLSDRLRSALSSVGLWSAVTTSYVLGPRQAAFALPLSLGLAVASMWIYLSLRVRYR